MAPVAQKHTLCGSENISCNVDLLVLQNPCKSQLVVNFFNKLQLHFSNPSVKVIRIFM